MERFGSIRTVLPALLVSMLFVACSGESQETLLASAKEYMAKKDDKAAVIQIKNALQANPDLAEARFLLGKALLATGDAAGAEVELRKAVALKYSADLVAPLLARSLLRQGQYKKVTEEFGSFTAGITESQADLKSAVAIAFASLGDDDAADLALTSALQAKPDYVPALLIQARLNASRGDLEGALSISSGIVARDQANADALKLHGDLLLAKGEIGPATESYRQALKAKPDLLAAHGSLISTLLAQNKIDEATQQVEDLKRLAPKHPMTALLEGRVAFVKEDLPRARDLAQQALAAMPGNPGALQLAGSVEFRMRSFVQAEAHFAKLVREAPDNAEAYRMLAMTQLRLGQVTRAKESLEPLLSKGSVDSNLLALAGEIAMRAGDIVKAESYFSRASALDPRDVPKKTAVALTHVARGSESAFTELERIALADKGVQADMALIAASLQQRQFDQALKAIAALEKKLPNSAQTHHLRGTALIGKNDLIGGRRSLERALTIDPAYFPSAAALAALDMGINKPDDARKRFEGILAADPKSIQALLALADLKARAGGSLEEVAAMIKRAVAANPESLPPRMALIDFYWKNGAPKLAMSAAQDAVSALPGRPEFLEALGRTQLAVGDTNQALASFGKWASSQPASALPLVRMAEAQTAAKDTGAAIQSLNKALTIQPDFVEAQRGLIGLHASTGAMEQAVGIARTVQRQRPKEAVGYLLEGDAQSSAKAWAAATAAYRAGLRNVSDTELAKRLYTALLADKKESEAEGFASKWVKENPKDAAFRMHLGDFALAARDLSRATAHYRSAVNIQPNNAIALNNLAWVGFQQKDPSALELAEKANRLVPGNPAIMDTLAIILMEKGDSKRAAGLLRDAFAKAPQSLDIRVNYARALIKSGDKEGARKEIDALTELGDKGPRKEILEQLKAAL